MASVEMNQMLAAAAAACEDKKAEDIRILALDPSESGLTDYFLICTGTNDRQTVAITDEIEIRLKREFATYPNSVEGRRQGEWVLMDYVDFIVHVFLPEKRAYYGLERLRPSATTLSIADLNTEIKAAITAKRPVKAAKTDATDVPDVDVTVKAPRVKKVADKQTKVAKPAELAENSSPAADRKTRVPATKKVVKKAAKKVAKPVVRSKAAS